MPPSLSKTSGLQFWGADLQAIASHGAQPVRMFLMDVFGVRCLQHDDICHIATRAPELIEDGANELPGAFRLLVQQLLDHLKELDRQVEELEDKIHAWHLSSDLSRKLAMVPGIGPITASALVASLGDAKNFDGGRLVAACLSLVPRQHSSGGKSNLLGMSKRGDSKRGLTTPLMPQP